MTATDPGPIDRGSPFHPGEHALQQRAGVRERLEDIGRKVIRDHMPDQHRELFEKLPTLLVGALDAAAQPWATMLAGRPGFITTPDARTLQVTTAFASDDPVVQAVQASSRPQPVGLLGLEPHTRRRNRMNGTLVQQDNARWQISVDQSFGNCPQYIQAREPAWVDTPPGPVTEGGAQLGPAAAALLGRTDTVFIASAAPGARAHGGPAGVDVSHRGGRPGFVRVRNDADGTRLSLPDFRGNFMFNTLGNLAVHPLAGLLVVDPLTGDMLHLAARAEIQWDGPEVDAFQGATRLLHLQVLAHRWRPGALPLRWRDGAPAPQLADTGFWPTSTV